MTAPTVNNSLTAIRTKVRRLTASPGESSLPTEVLDDYINTFYSNDFPYAIKLDQMRSVYTFYTEPYIDQYPLDVNYNQGIRSPAYVDGINATFFKDRQQFYNMWPRFFTEYTETVESATVVTQDITNVTFTSSHTVVNITSPGHGLATGAIVFITGVVGTTQINDQNFRITVVNSGRFRLDDVDATGFTDYVSGGTWTTTEQTFDFTLSGAPFLRNQVFMGGVTDSGEGLTFCDDGNGNLNYLFINDVVPEPGYINAFGLNDPGMHNLNTGNPGQQNIFLVGTVDYVTGRVQFTAPPGILLATGSDLTVKVSQYKPAKPYSILFFNNYFQVRPIPKKIHKVEIETYLTPVQFFEETDCPILNQWWQYIALGAAIKILEDRSDFDGVNAITPIFNKQEALILERQGVEEIGQQNTTIYNSVVGNPGWNSQGWY